MPADTPNTGEADTSGAEQRQAWFMSQRSRTIVAKDPAKDVEDELPPVEPGDPHDQPADLPPSLADLMREYRQRLHDSTDAAGDSGAEPAPDAGGGGAGEPGAGG